MTNVQKMKRGLLATVAAGGLILAASTAVQAAAIVKFAPGLATAADESNIYPIGGPFSTDPDTPTPTDLLKWQALNNSLLSDFWKIKINKLDSTFTETFTFKLKAATKTGPGDSIYGGVANTQTYVTMVADLSGTVNDVNATTDALQLSYTASTFKMYYHDDGIATSSGVAGAPSLGGAVHFATFDLTSGSGTPVASQDPDRWNLSWTADASFILNDSITDLSGNALDVSQTRVAFTNQQIRLPAPLDNLGSGDTTVGDERTLLVGFTTAGTTVFQNVPEPGTLALFGVGLLGMGLATRRRKTVKTKTIKTMAA